MYTEADINNINQKYLQKGCHDIRNIISIINGNYQLVELLHNELSSDPRWMQLGNDITYLIHTMNSIGSFRHASTIYPKDCSLSEFLKDFIAGLSANPVYTSLDININISSDMAHAVIDTDKINYVLYSLIDNIADINPCSSLSITAYSDDACSYIHISDNHQGLSSEIAAELFEPFNTNKSGHPGLSLATSYRILLAHNGQLAYSGNSQNGSTFTLILPVPDNTI